MTSGIESSAVASVMVVKLTATTITARPAAGRSAVGKRTALAASSNRPQPSPRTASASGKRSQQTSKVIGRDRVSGARRRRLDLGDRAYLPRKHHVPSAGG